MPSAALIIHIRGLYFVLCMFNVFCNEWAVSFISSCNLATPWRKGDVMMSMAISCNWGGQLLATMISHLAAAIDHHNHVMSHYMTALRGELKFHYRPVTQFNIRAECYSAITIFITFCHYIIPLYQMLYWSIIYHDKGMQLRDERLIGSHLH